VYKAAYITPLLKKSGLDATDVRSYRPISNLSTVSKLLERLVAQQLIDYLKTADLLPQYQSAYRPFHSTETAVLHVLSEILTAVDRGDVAALILLDLSAAFDTVDHDILLRRLQYSYGVTGSANRWFRSYLCGRTQYVRLGSTKSSITHLTCGVPQGSVLGPILFVLYTADLVRLVERHSLQVHLYADDTPVFGSCPPRDVDALHARLTACLDDVALWMRANRLQLNTDKTELLWCATARRRNQLPSTPLRVGSHLVNPVTSVRNLGIYIDADLSGRTHVTKTAAACFAALRQLRGARRSIPTPAYKSLVVSLVLNRLDYGNATLSGLPDYQCRRLQAVLNAAAKSIFRLRRSDHVTPALIELHWLSAADRINFKIATLVYRCLHGTAPRYLSSALHIESPKWKLDVD
jgi:Reverse transcriptase (RNA-dependent DNA polymerase)